jgi:hypothetical protein
MNPSIPSGVPAGLLLGIINYDGYVIDNCSSRMLNFSGTTEKHPEV